MVKLQPRQPKAIPFTQDGYDKVKAEFGQLTLLRPDAVENLRKAREMGDLSENGYYKAARARLSDLDRRLRHLTLLIRLGRVVVTASTGTVQIGSKVSVSDGKKERIFLIVGGYESSPHEGKISHVSPIGRALLGKRVGERVAVHAPAGILMYEIRSIR